MRTLDLAARGEPPAFVEQDEAGATYAEKIGPEDRRLDPALGAVKLERIVRALHPHIGARLALEDGTLLGVHAARVAADGPGDGPPAGTLARDGERLLYGTADGALELLCVQPAGGRAMDGGAYLRGHAR